MGQPVTVIEKPSATAGIVRYETNRPLSGMGHEIYRSIDDVQDDRPVDQVARAVFEWGPVETVHINGSVVTVHLGSISPGPGLKKALEDVFLFYRD